MAPNWYEGSILIRVMRLEQLLRLKLRKDQILPNYSAESILSRVSRITFHGDAFYSKLKVSSSSFPLSSSSTISPCIIP